VSLVILMLFSSAVYVPAGLFKAPIVANAQQSCTPQDSVSWVMVVPPSSLNPNTLVTPSGTDTPALIMFGMYYSPQGVPEQNGTFDQHTSVTDWITHNSNYTQWMFHIKPGLRWSNGQNVTAEDLIASYSTKMYYNSSYDILGLGPEIKDSYALNSSTAVYDLNVSDAQLANKFSVDTIGSVVFPASIVNQYGAAYPNLGTTISMGPYYVSNYSAGQFQMTLLRNPYFQPQPKWCQITINFVESLSQTANNLLSGSTDVGQVEPSNVPAILKDPNLQVLDEKGMFQTSLEYNITVYPYNMTAFRQALAYGINQNNIVQQAFAGYAATAYGSEGTVYNASNSYWFNPNIKKYDFNQTASLALLNSIGITKGSDGLLHYPNGTAVSITLWAATDSAVDVIGAQSIKSDLQNLGFTVNVQTTSSANIIGDYATNVDNIARTGLILATTTLGVWGFILDDVLPGWDVYFTPTVPNIYWEYPPSVNDQYQSNLSAIYATDNQTQLRQYAYNIQAINSQNLPTIMLAFPDEIWAFNTQRWTGWPTQGQFFVWAGFVPNPEPLLNIQPVSSETTSTSTSPVTTTTSSASSSSPSSTSSQPSTSLSTTQSSSGGTNLALLAGVAIVVVVVIVGAAVFLRRPKRPAAPG
jgi:ABC-type transport system substrate-binding protein